MERKKIKNIEKNKKNYISIIIIIIGLIIIAVFVKKIMNYQKQEINDTITNNQIIFDKEKLDFECDLINPEEKTKNYPTYTQYSYGVGDYIYCKINNYNKYQPTKLNIFYYNGDNKNIDLIDIKSLTEDWKINLTTNEKYNDISIVSSNENSKLQDIVFKFYIKSNNDKYDIKISSIGIDDDKYKIYNKVIELPTGKKYRLKFTNDKIESYKLSTDGSYIKIKDSECKECHIYVPQAFIYEDYQNGKVVISDLDNLKMLYDMNKGIIGTYGSIYWLYSKNDTYKEGTYLYVGNKDNTKYGIIDKDGNIIKDYVLEKECSGNQIPRNCLRYSIEDNLLATKKNNKYGIIRLTSDDIVIDYKYDDIKLINSKYFQVKENDKWYIYNYSSKDKQIEKGYDYIYSLADNVLIVKENNNWIFKNYNNITITDNQITTNDEYKYLVYYTDEKNKNIIHIEVTETEYGAGGTLAYYDFNIEKNTLTKIEK